MFDRIQCNATEIAGRRITQLIGDPTVRCLVQGNSQQHRHNADEDVVEDFLHVLVIFLMELLMENPVPC